MGTEQIIEDELRWIDKCENAQATIPYDAFRASLRRVQNSIKRNVVKDDM